MKFFTNLWKKMKNIGCRYRWPKLVRFEIRDAECNLLAIRYATIWSYDAIMFLGEKFSNEAMSQANNNEYIDESYWSYEVLK